MTEIEEVTHVHLIGDGAVDQFIPHVRRALGNLIPPINKEHCTCAHTEPVLEDPFNPFGSSFEPVCVDISLADTPGNRVITITATRYIYADAGVQSRFVRAEYFVTKISTNDFGTWDIEQHAVDIPDCRFCSLVSLSHDWDDALGAVWDKLRYCERDLIC